jgi:hypothetical protein
MTDEERAIVKDGGIPDDGRPNQQGWRKRIVTRAGR